MYGVEDYRKGSNTLIKNWGNVKTDEKVLIIIDDSTEDVGRYLLESAKKITNNLEQIKIKVASMHGEEPSVEAAKAMLEADVVFSVTKFSMTHTKARMDSEKKCTRFLTLADYDLEQLASPALLTEFQPWSTLGKKIKDLLDGAQEVKITAEKGTNLVIDVSDRIANHCPGYADKPGMLGSPPAMETNISPIEGKSEGTIVVDGSIPCREVGLVKEDIKVKVEQGMITKIDLETEQAEKLKKLLDRDNNPKKKILAEFGIGLNPKAKLCNSMLEDEGCLSTIHFGFGSNYTVGGKNKVPFHLDFVIKNPTVYVDNKVLMKDGYIVIP